MRVLRRTGTIAAPGARVFALLEDPRIADQLNPTFLRTRVVTSAWLPRPGAHTVVEIDYRGARFRLETEIAEYRRGSFLLERQAQGPFRSLEHAVSVEAESDGVAPATRITEVLAYAPSFGLLGRLFDRVVLSRDLEVLLGERQHRLRQILEAERDG